MIIKVDIEWCHDALQTPRCLYNGGKSPFFGVSKVEIRMVNNFFLSHQGIYRRGNAETM